MEEIIEFMTYGKYDIYLILIAMYTYLQITSSGSYKKTPSLIHCLLDTYKCISFYYLCLPFHAIQKLK